MPCWNPSDYHRHSTSQQIWARELIEKLRLTGQERVLDIGSGDGKVSAEIAECLPRGSVVGVDSSAEMIRFANKQYPAERHPRLHFELADARQLQFRERFDVVFSSATLHWVIDHRPVLAGIGRALVAGGRALLQMGGQGNAAGVVEAAGDLIAQHQWGHLFEGFSFPYGFYGPDTYRPWVESAGLRPVRIELLPKDMTLPGVEPLRGWVRTTWLPYLERVPPERRSEFVDELVTRYVGRHPLDAEGCVHVAMVRLEAELVKDDCTDDTPLC